MKKLQYALFLGLLFCLHSFSQNICQNIYASMFIENNVDIPSVTENGDGTITLVHPDQAITNVFANYTIYGFERTFPATNSELLMKYYTVFTDTNDLFVTIQNEISDAIYVIDQDYSIPSAVPNDLVNFVHGKSFDIHGVVSFTDLDGCFYPNCPFIEGSVNYPITINFNYDANQDLLFVETDATTPCGNSFSIAMKATSTSNNEIGLQIWSIDEVTDGGNTDQDCHQIEYLIFTVFEILCSNDFDNNSASRFLIDEDNGEVVFLKNNLLFGEDIVVLKDNTFSVSDNVFALLSIFQPAGKEYLQLVNNLDAHITASILTTSGKLVVQDQLATNNQIDISSLSKGVVYFVQLKNSENQVKYIKFIKR